MARSIWASLFFAFVGSHAVLSVRVARTQSTGGHVVIAPEVKNLKPVAVIMNPGAGVSADMYSEHMQRWQAEAAKQGMSMWVSVLSYWFDLPLPVNLQRNIKDALSTLRNKEGLPQNAPVFLSGHSMGGGVIQSAALENYGLGECHGLILQASYLNAEWFSPMTPEKDFSYALPTLTVGADLNFGAGRVTRIAAAAYRQRSLPVDNYPVVVIEGMNHMQFATGFEKEDLKPEISWATAQQHVARLAVDFIAKQMNIGAGAYIRSEVQRTNAIFDPIYSAFELEADAKFGYPNQKSAPNNHCPRGVCPTSSEWVNIAQKHILGDITPKFQVQNNFADLNPWSLDSRDPRKPFIDGNKIQCYEMDSNTDKDFSLDVKTPVASNEMLAKMISRQYAVLSATGKDVGEDGDLCVEINQMAFDKAMQLASPLARQRYAADGQPMVFEPTEYKTIGPVWVSSQMQFKEKNGKMSVKTYGLFTPPGNRAIDGNHYCKLLTPGRALEWIYVDGLKAKNFAVWS